MSFTAPEVTIQELFFNVEKPFCEKQKFSTLLLLLGTLGPLKTVSENETHKKLFLATFFPPKVQYLSFFLATTCSVLSFKIISIKKNFWFFRIFSINSPMPGAHMIIRDKTT